MKTKEKSEEGCISACWSNLSLYSKYFIDLLIAVNKTYDRTLFPPQIYCLCQNLLLKVCKEDTTLMMMMKTLQSTNMYVHAAATCSLHFQKKKKKVVLKKMHFYKLLARCTKTSCNPPLSCQKGTKSFNVFIQLHLLNYIKKKDVKGIPVKSCPNSI